MDYNKKWGIIALIAFIVAVPMWFTFYDYESWIIHALKFLVVLVVGLCASFAVTHALEYLEDHLFDQGKDSGVKIQKDKYEKED